MDFYGYDEGDLDATVTFRAHPPTGSGQVLLTDAVFIGEDNNSGGGSQAGLDASETYTLDLSGFTPHPQQGFHVKLTVNAEGSQGADKKHKVFWVQDCHTTDSDHDAETVEDSDRRRADEDSDREANHAAHHKDSDHGTDHARGDAGAGADRGARWCHRQRQRWQRFSGAGRPGPCRWCGSGRGRGGCSAPLPA